MAEGQDGLDPLLLDTIVRAHGPTVTLGLVVSMAAPVLLAVGAGGGSWAAVVVGLGLLVLATRALTSRAIRIDRDLAAVQEEP